MIIKSIRELLIMLKYEIVNQETEYIILESFLFPNTLLVNLSKLFFDLEKTFSTLIRYDLNSRLLDCNSLVMERKLI